MTEQNDHDLLTELNVKLDVLTTQMLTHIKSAERLHSDQEIRIRMLEQWKWRWAGAVAVAVLIWNFASAVIANGVLK